MEPKKIVLYHGSGCADGFGGAYAAWKKFGDSAEYIPLSRGEVLPVETCAGADVYFIDFVYDDPAIMAAFVSAAASVTALDHHEGVRSVTEGVPKHVFDSNRSGASIAWDFFHPGEPRPKLINHVEDDDLFRFTLADTREIITYLEVQPFDFEVWDEFAHKLDDPTAVDLMMHTARAYRDYFEKMAAIAVDHAKLVSFDGHEIYFATAGPVKSLRSLVGNLLAKKKGPCSLVVSAHPNGYGVSIRGDGSVDVSKIAAKFGGNGHPNSSGFLIPREGPFPWTLIETDENSRN
jgi:oligoribonuclease NrnB/cAMP/cGMP phosphodiesterase (DHH superfamily)